MIYERFYSQVQKCFHFLDMLFFLLFFFAFFPAGGWEEDAASASLDSAGASWLLQSSLLPLLFSSFASSRFFATQTICHQYVPSYHSGVASLLPVRNRPIREKDGTEIIRAHAFVVHDHSLRRKQAQFLLYLLRNLYESDGYNQDQKHHQRKKQIQLLTVQKSQKGVTSSPGTCIKPPNAGDIFYINCSCRIIWTN